MKKILMVAALSVCFAGNVAAADAEAGKKLVADKGCATCHGANGESPASPVNP